jgi:hypothetical protein
MTEMNDGPIDVLKIRVEFPNKGQYNENDPRFLEELRLLREELSVPGTIKAACIHETGHLKHFRLLGRSLQISPDKFWFIGPRVTYGLNRRYQFEFDHDVAATRTPFDKDSLDLTDETLQLLANACYAGGVYTSELAKGSLTGDTMDIIQFHAYYDSAIKQRGGQPELLESELIDIAIRVVTDELQDANIRDEGLRSADLLDMGLRLF